MAALRVAAGSGAVVLAVLAGVLASWRAPPAGGDQAGPPAVAVLALARDLPQGAVPARADLRTVLLPATAVPADAVRGPAGLDLGPLALQVRRGDVLTRRQLGAGWGRAGLLRAYALPVGDGVEAGPLAPGDRVDVLAASRGRASTVVSAAPVLRLEPGGDGRALQVVLGVTGGQAETLAAARVAGTLTLVQAPPATPG